MRGKYFYVKPVSVGNASPDNVLMNVGYIRIPGRSEIPIHTIIVPSKIEDMTGATFGLYGAKISSAEDGRVNAIFIDSRFYTQPEYFRKFTLYQIIGMLLWGYTDAYSISYEDVGQTYKDSDNGKLLVNGKSLLKISEAVRESVRYAMRTLSKIDRNCVCVRLRQIKNTEPKDSFLGKWAQTMINMIEPEDDYLHDIEYNSLMGKLYRAVHAWDFYDTVE